MAAVALAKGLFKPVRELEGDGGVEPVTAPALGVEGGVEVVVTEMEPLKEGHADALLVASGEVEPVGDAVESRVVVELRE